MCFKIHPLIFFQRKFQGMLTAKEFGRLVAFLSTTYSLPFTWNDQKLKIVTSRHRKCILACIEIHYFIYFVHEVNELTKELSRVPKKFSEVGLIVTWLLGYGWGTCSSILMHLKRNEMRMYFEQAFLMDVQHYGKFRL